MEREERIEKEKAEGGPDPRLVEMNVLGAQVAPLGAVLLFALFDASFSCPESCALPLYASGVPRSPVNILRWVLFSRCMLMLPRPCSIVLTECSLHCMFSASL